MKPNSVLSRQLASSLGRASNATCRLFALALEMTSDFQACSASPFPNPLRAQALGNSMHGVSHFAGSGEGSERPVELTHGVLVATWTSSWRLLCDATAPFFRTGRCSAVVSAPRVGMLCLVLPFASPRLARIVSKPSVAGASMVSQGHLVTCTWNSRGPPHGFKLCTAVLHKRASA